MKNITFNKKRLAASISMILSAGVVTNTYAAEEPTATEEQPTEIIEVTGIRDSLARSSLIKRSSSGVVDAISSEEMGKFPDTNLAESLQRITGVTVSRSNGEGSEITVRGFGPDFNLITLNGRQMPGTGNTRSYKLENLSSEGVTTLEVVKTARSDLPSGGLGATVNIVTTKPLASPGLKYSVSAKGIYDESTDTGDSITPELAAVYSNTFDDERFGVSLSLSHQRRHFQQQGAAVDGWQEGQSLGAAVGSNAIDNRLVDGNGDLLPLFSKTVDGVVETAATTFLPRNLGYAYNNVERERTNGQLTLQFAPTDDFIATLDYTATEAIQAEEGLAFGVWFNFGGNIKSYELDENGTAVRFNEANNDYAHTARQGTTEVKAKSLGLNFDWQLTESIHLELDMHDSENKIDNGADPGSKSSPFFILGPNNLLSKTYDYTQGEIPQIEMFWPDNAAEASAGDFDPLFGEFLRGRGKSEIQQVQFDINWENLDDGALAKIDGGVAYTKQTIGGQSASSSTQSAGDYGGNQAIYPDSMFTRQDTGNFLDELDGGGSDLTTNYYYSYDIDEAISRAAAYFDGFDTNPLNNGWDSDAEVIEETTSAYLQAGFIFEVANIPVAINAGVRYEQTDVESNTQSQVEEDVVWRTATEWNLRYIDDAASFLTTTGDYDVVLPSLDIMVDVTDDIIARASFGKSLTRAPLGNLVASRALSSNPKPGGRTGASGNTGLLPFESTNIDLSLEYYYGEGSYASLGWFQKDVKNFVVNDQQIITVDGLHDPLIGPRAQQAIADLGGTSINDVEITDLFNQIVANGGDVDGEIFGRSDDPLVEWLVTQPVNADSKKVDGIEVAIQHLFDESGYGIAANATFVNGDVKFDPYNLDVQSPLNGLGDSANLQAFYDKDGLSVKFTYAWRDAYLLGIGQAQGSADAPPQFFKEFGQLDLSVNYDLDDNTTVFFEGINLTNETEQIFGRFEEQFLSARQYGTRYTLGARYTF